MRYSSFAQTCCELILWFWRDNEEENEEVNDENSPPNQSVAQLFEDLSESQKSKSCVTSTQRISKVGKGTENVGSLSVRRKLVEPVVELGHCHEEEQDKEVATSSKSARHENSVSYFL